MYALLINILFMGYVISDDYTNENCLGYTHMEMVDLNNKIIGTGDCYGSGCIKEMCKLWALPNAYLLLAVPENIENTKTSQYHKSDSGKY